MKIKTQFCLLCAFLVFILACEKIFVQPPDPETVLAGPVEGLSLTQEQTHLRGDVAFAKTFGEADGLGPVFVSASCESCHAGDGKGHPAFALTRFGKMTASGFDPLHDQGGGQLQHRAISGYLAEVVPASATGFSRFIAPAVSGLGFLEAVPDSFFLALADPDDLNGDGISGIPSWIDPPGFFTPQTHHQPNGGKYMGRFGRKAGAIDLKHQTANAYLQDMGISSTYLEQDIYNPLAGGAAFDAVADPEISQSEVNNVVFYLQTLKAPPRRNEMDALVTEGQSIFMQIGCGSCHVPDMTTGDHLISALSQKVFHPYTDLLLHDMGPELDDAYTEGSATTAEWRTTPLWGLGLSAASQGGNAYYLHDGRATSLEAAIMLHGGEGAASRSGFESLTPDEKQKLIAFLESL